MKKNLKKLIASILVALTVISVAPMSKLVKPDFDLFDTGIKASAKDLSSYSVGDIITFGSYPQTKVKSSSTISALDSLSKNWISYGYYSGTGEDDGQMKSSAYMKYCDLSYNGNKYRAVTFSSYRPFYTNIKRNSNNSYQDNNGYYTGNIYYFKFEPLKWRILDPKNGFVMCTTAIDSQAYNNYSLYDDFEYFGNSSKTYYASNWEKSSIRKWLNNNFYNTAFTSSEKTQIKTTQFLMNKSSLDSKYNSPSTNDKIFLLSYQNVINNEYGFSSSYSKLNSKRRLKSTDYAKCQGCYQETDSSYLGNCLWLLRSPNNSFSICDVDAKGSVYFEENTCSTHTGIVPAFNFVKESKSDSSVSRPPIVLGAMNDVSELISIIWEWIKYIFFFGWIIEL